MAMRECPADTTRALGQRMLHPNRVGIIPPLQLVVLHRVRRTPVEDVEHLDHEFFDLLRCIVVRRHARSKRCPIRLGPCTIRQRTLRSSALRHAAARDSRGASTCSREIARPTAGLCSRSDPPEHREVVRRPPAQKETVIGGAEPFDGADAPSLEQIEQTAHRLQHL